MQIFMLIRQLDVFDPLKIRKLRANSNWNSKLELDDFEPSKIEYLRSHYVGQ